MRHLIILLFLISQIAAAPQLPSQSPEKNNPVQTEETHEAELLDEIGLTAGTVVRAKIVAVSEHEVAFKQADAFGQTKIPIEKVQFIRRATGEYRFFPAATPETKKEPVKSSGKTGVYLIGGMGMHFANNSGSKEYILSVANSLASNFNLSNNPKGFTSTVQKDVSAMQWQFFAEPRIYGDRWMLGLSAGYATFSQISSTVQSPFYIYELTVSMTGFFVPVTALYYWRLPLSGNTAINLGFGAGLLYTSVKFSVNDDGYFYNFSQKYTAWNAALIFKPEITHQLGDLLLIASFPVYFAESRKVEFGTEALSNIDTGKVISPNLTGVGVSIAFGYQLR